MTSMFYEWEWHCRDGCMGRGDTFGGVSGASKIQISVRFRE